MIEGKASLFYYEDRNLTRFFYQLEGNGNIEQLVYKSYVTRNDKIAKNNGFRDQLWGGLKSPTFKIMEDENLNDRKKELIDFFIAYNECSRGKYFNYTTKDETDLFNLSIRPGLNLSGLSINNSF